MDTDEDEDDGFIAEDRSEGTTQQGSEGNEDQARFHTAPQSTADPAFKTPCAQHGRAQKLDPRSSVEADSQEPVSWRATARRPCLTRNTCRISRTSTWAEAAQSTGF